MPSTLSSTQLVFSGNDGTITGCTAMTVSDNPTNATDVANKSYVDSVAAGLDVKDSVRVATTAEVVGTYTTGVLTVTAVGQIQADDVILYSGDRLLLKDQSSVWMNGIYVVTVEGDGSTAATLTRSSDMAENSLPAGNFTFIEQGTIYADTGFVCTTDTGSMVGNVDEITFTQFSGASALSGGQGINITGTVVSVSGIVDTTDLRINGTSVVAPAADLNLLQGSTPDTVVNGKAVIYGPAGEITADKVSSTEVWGTTVNATTLNGTTVNVIGTLAAGSDVNITGTLNASSTANITGVIEAGSDVNVTGTLNANGNATVGGTLATGDTTVTGTIVVSGIATADSHVSSSDRRLKKNIKVLKNCVDKVKKIRGVNFTWIADGRKDYGVIAQEIEKVAPFAVHMGEDGMRKVDYGKLAPLFIESIKEQQQVIEGQQSEIDGLKEQFEELKAKVNELLK